MAPCSSCRKAKVKPGEERPKCVVGLRSRRCSECVRKGYTQCDVTLSRPEWERVRDVRDRLRLELQRHEEQEMELMQRIFDHRRRTLRLRKELRQAESRTETAAEKELEALEEADRVEADAFGPVAEAPEGVEVASRDFVHGILEMSPIDWSVIDGDNPFGEVSLEQLLEVPARSAASAL